ncbi:MAG: class I SAM-dependent methyltransferase [Phycisphaerales bacterium]|nr:class I SAM-dependent methyltransferase [Phycisphaerales bacterium]
MRTKAEVLRHFDDFAVDDRWSKLYAADGDAVENHSFIARRQCVEKLLAPALRPGASVLDMGCGTGVMAPFVLNAGLDYFGIDLSEEMVEHARKTADLCAKQGQTVELSTGDVDAIQYPDAHFDCVIALGLLEYLDDVEAAVGELSRVTKIGGTIIVSVPSSFCADAVTSRLFSPIVTNAARAVRSLRGGSKPAGHFFHRKFRPATLDRILVGHHCEKSGQAYYNVEVLCYPFRRAMPRLSLRVKQWAEQYDNGLVRPFATAYVGRYVRRS